MSVALIISGFFGFIICLIWLIVLAIRRKQKKSCLYTLIVCVFLFLIGAATLSNEDSETAQNDISSSALSASTLSSSQAVATSSESDAIEVDYKTLWKDYDANPINADKKYRDKKLILTGVVAEIDRDIAQSPYITFDVDQHGLQSIKMSFDDDEPVAKLKKGQTVTVKGICGGTFTSTLIVLRHCEIVTQ